MRAKGELRAAARRLLASRSGATVVEYGLIAGAIAIVLITTLQSLGTTLSSKFQYWAYFFASH